ncbi:hypothetical protein EYZ11_013052 [Aspergillus tanneri]|uniref:Uncharacterized protein n=1 Tax=Aspergillus tanneri TaxID=1220188 RepID=A0A4S3IZ58_9EURO|nr:hypothetical protein EYZ11_013052 [Aspergillus tanneri]
MSSITSRVANRSRYTAISVDLLVFAGFPKEDDDLAYDPEYVFEEDDAREPYEYASDYESVNNGMGLDEMPLEEDDTEAQWYKDWLATFVTQ